jgi:proteasome accessory factor B
MPELPGIVRHWTILTAMMARRYGLTVKDMVELTAAQERVIRRDIKTLQELGFPLIASTSDFGRKHWKLGENARLPRIEFNLTEALSLYLCRRLMEPLAGTDIWEGAETAFRKIRAYFSEQALAHLDRMSGMFYNTTLGITDYSDKREIIDTLLIAIEDHKSIAMSYQSNQATEPVSYYELRPYGMVQHRQSLYLVAFDPQHSAVRHYKVDRIASVDAIGFPFPKPKDFNIADHLAGSFGIHFTDAPPVTIRVRFASVVARYVQEKKYHPTQKAARGPDGSVILTFELSDLVELKSWLLGFGANAVVLEPACLRDEILETLRAGLEVYAEQAASELPATDGQAASAKRSGKKTGRSRSRRVTNPG